MYQKFLISFSIFSILILFLSSYSSKMPSTYVFPCDYLEISSDFGYRELFSKQNFHNGLDYLAPQGALVYAITSGTVLTARFLPGYGNCIILLHDNGIKSLYGHLDETFIVKEGDYITYGQTIAKVGPKYLSNGKLNGNTTGPHLHFSIFNASGQAISPFTLTYQKKK